ncbi:nucleotide disphospho-sugar-binding domain-containing protein [Amycolatopsis sp. cmx-4-61]|uniref:nucleotide disphospho-sugar-binding domain-containing protein n=1 Tax=Amycolatopsis sp. cmx-4-61 TaxID=2790937 RepID=UPI00397A7BB2
MSTGGRRPRAMRVLFVMWGWRTHLHPVAPLAWALRGAGHEVRVLGQPALGPAITELGLTAVAAGPDVDVLPEFRKFVLPVEARPAPEPPADGVPRALKLFARLADEMAGDAVRFAQAWRPDLVVAEPTAFAGPLVAAALGIPSVRHLYGPDLVARAARFLPGLLEPIGGRLGVGPVDPLAGTTIDPTPSCLHAPGDLPRRLVRYLPCSGPERAEVVLGPVARPRVCVTWGHTMELLGPQYFLAGETARAVAELDVNVVLAVSARQRALLGDLPPTVSVFVDPPLDRLLAHCDVLVSQGGAGSVLTGLAAGLPQVAVGQLPDHLAIARRLEAAGAGRALAAAEFSAAAVAGAVFDVLQRSGFAAAARRARLENEGRPAPAELVADLRSLAGR